MNIMNRFKQSEYELHIDEPWVLEAAEQLRQPLHPHTAAQLSAIRRSALAQQKRQSKLPSFFVWGVPALASVVAIVLSFSFWQTPDNDMPLHIAENTALEDLSIIKASDDLEFYQNLEFLLWMERAENGLPKG